MANPHLAAAGATARFHLNLSLDLKASAPFKAIDYVALFDALSEAASHMRDVMNQPRCHRGDRLSPAGDLILQVAEDLENLASQTREAAKADTTIVTADDVERRAWLEISDAAAFGEDMTEFALLVLRKMAEVNAAKPALLPS